MAVDHCKRCITQGRVVGHIVAEFGPCKPLLPLPWVIAGHAVEIDLDNLVDHLRLTVRLRMEGGAHVKTHLEEMEKLLPKLANENKVSVGENSGWETMKTDDVGEEHSCRRSRSIWMHQMNKVGIFGETVNDHYYDCLSVETRKPYDEIYGNVLPELRGNRLGLEKADWVQIGRLVALISSVGMNKILDGPTHADHIEVTANFMQGLLNSLVVDNMNDCNDGRQGWRRWPDEDLAVVCDEAIGDCPWRWQITTPNLCHEVV